MINVIGLGHAGCAIATKFLFDTANYKVLLIDAEGSLDGPGTVLLGKQESFRAYEENTPFVSEFTELEGKVYFILAGGGDVTGSTLVLLEQLKKKDITVFYIRPDLDLCSEDQRLKARATFKILQEFSRSGLLSNMVLFDNKKIEKTLEDLSIMDYNRRINDVISSAILMRDYVVNTDSVAGEFVEPKEISRIATIGMCNIESEEENYFFPFENIREKQYGFAVPSEELEGRKFIFGDVRRVLAKNVDDLCVSYKIVPTDYRERYVYIYAFTNFIQD